MRWRKLPDPVAGEKGATTIEYIMILSLFSVPLSLIVGTALSKILRELITVIVEHFTRG